MTLQSFLEKNILFLVLINILFGLVIASNPDADDDSNSFSSHGKCKNCLSQCKNPLVRKDWRTLSNIEKQKYINAVKCLYQKPSLPALHSKFPGTINRLDDFTAVHSNQSDYIHFTGYFFHWHRLFVAVYEKALREECNYTSAHPYWNIAKDLADDPHLNHINDWIIFSNITGFGGNGFYVNHTGVPNPFDIQGSIGGGCVPAGPFGVGSTYKVHLLPGTDTSTNNPRCLTRDFTPIRMAQCTQSRVDVSLNQPTFFDFHKSVQVLNFSIPAIHGGVHWGVGGVLGTVGDFYKSPGDPLFYMLHANLDRIYAEWEAKNPCKRLCETGGPTVPFDYSLTQGPPVTPNFKINIDVMSPNTEVGNLLSTRAGVLCYKYDTIP